MAKGFDRCFVGYVFEFPQPSGTRVCNYDLMAVALDCFNRSGNYLCESQGEGAYYCQARSSSVVGFIVCEELIGCLI